MNQVDADRIVLVGGAGDGQFGADPIGRGDQDRILETRRLEIEQAAEAAKRGVRARPSGASGQGFYRLDQCVPGIDVDAGIPVGQSVIR